MDFLYIKSIHIVFVVTWFAALFYMVRLFIYTVEAQNKPETEKNILTEQLLTMQKKLWFIIGWPGAIGATVFGFWMIFTNWSYYLAQPWMWLKLIFVGFLILYHMQCHFIYNKQRKNIFKWNSFQLRLYNELATVFLVAIVFLVVVKSTGSLVWSLLGLFLFAALLMAFVTIYRNMREKEIARKKPEEEKKTSI